MNEARLHKTRSVRRLRFLRTNPQRNFSLPRVVPHHHGKRDHRHFRMYSSPLPGRPRLMNPPHHTDWPGKFPYSLATRHLVAYNSRNRLATKLVKTFGGLFSRNTALVTTGYAFCPIPLLSASARLNLRVVSLPNSCISGTIHNRSSEYVIPSALYSHSSRTGNSNPHTTGWRLLQRGRSWGWDQVCSSKRANRSRGRRSQPCKSTFGIDLPFALCVSLRGRPCQQM